FPNAAQVVIASSTSVADAMAAGPLGASINGPVLITPPTGLDPRVAAEIRRLGATTATIIGGTTALGPQVDTDLAAAGVTTLTRIAGADRYDTAVKAAERVWGQKPATQRKAVIALGNHTDPARAWPDALTAGYLGSLTSAPVLLVGLTGVTPGTLAALDGIASATIIGGNAAVPVPIADLVNDHLPQPAKRLSGVDRYATSNTVASAAVATGASVSTVWAMTGRSPWDALAAGAAVAHLDQVLVLVDGLNGSSDMSISRWLVTRGAQITRGRIIGGIKVVTDAAGSRLARRIY
ncbi:MAG TPA: cell wall-binding repeat-containing protein, partial [Acidimicrobiales bacterium]|nr:cell wall-binding repeat-containing protein [Acidimicrobiales bacterium]